jgi:hypothetical protein
MPTPLPFGSYITEAQSLISNFGLLPVIMASTIIGLGAFLLRRMRAAAR